VAVRRSYVSDTLDDFADLDAVDRDGISWRRVAPQLLRCRLRRLFGLERDHSPAGVVVKPDPLRTDEARRLRYARYGLLSQERACLINVVKRGLSDDCVHGCLPSVSEHSRVDCHRGARSLSWL
jgi:hypothetical protein